ncbi:MAG: CpaF family protein [Bacteriovoracaceae bacterium]
MNNVARLISELSSKPDVTEIIINGPTSIFVERAGELVKLSVPLSVDDIRSYTQEIAKLNRKELTEETPILDGNLADGSRVNMILEPFALGCPAITIRRYLKSINRFETSPGIFGLSPKWIKLLKAIIDAKMNFVVSGGTGVGKTTFMNLMLQEVSKSDRVITIEDTKELNFELPNVVRLEARTGTSDGLAKLSIRDLVKNTLRMRPDRIVIGEVRGGELFDLLQAMNTGHEGSFTSIHANNPAECLMRMENLFYLSGYDVPVKAIRYQFSTAIDFIIQLGRLREGGRIVKQISELTGMEGDRTLMSDIAKANDKGNLRSTGLAVKRMDELMRVGLPADFFNTKD